MGGPNQPPHPLETAEGATLDRVKLETHPTQRGAFHITQAFVSCGGKVANRYLNTFSSSFFDYHSSHPDPIAPNQHPSTTTQTMHLSSRQQGAARSAKVLKCTDAPHNVWEIIAVH